MQIKEWNEKKWNESNEMCYTGRKCTSISAFEKKE